MTAFVSSSIPLLVTSMALHKDFKSGAERFLCMMMKRKIFWLMLPIFLSVFWTLVIIEFLKGLMSIASLVIIFFIVPFCVIMVNEILQKEKVPYRAVLLIVVGFSGAFTGGLYGKLFESMTLSENSVFDISNCAMIFWLRNTGLTDLKILGICVSNITYTLTWPPYVSSYVLLPRGGETALLVVHYAREMFQWIRQPPSEFKIETHLNSGYVQSLSSDQNPTPVTFTDGERYQVTFHTQSVLQHSFWVEAKPTSKEELSASAHSYFHGNETKGAIQTFIRFNNTGTSHCYIYNISIGDVTFQFTPPMFIEPTPPLSEFYNLKEIGVDFGTYAGIGYTGSFYGIITATPTPTLSMFKVDNTYEVTIWTMTNNYCTTNVTITG
jgi:hypothetical protein